MSIPTFACVLRSGGDFLPKHVLSLQDQVRRNTTVPHEFVCYSDVEIPGVQTVPLVTDWPGWWAVPEVFRQQGPTVITGLDTIVCGNIDKLFGIAMESSPDEFWMIRAFNPRRNDYASGVMAYNGDFSCVYKQFDLKRAQEQHGRGGEQEHTKAVLRSKGVKIKALQDHFPGIYSYKRHCRHRVPANCRIMVFHGQPRPWDVKGLLKSLPDTTTAFTTIPRVWPDSTVYILGGGPSLLRADLTSLRGKNVLGVNQAFEIKDCPVEYTYSGDQRWYGWNKRRLPDYPGTLITSYPQFKPDPQAPVMNVKRISTKGIHTGGPDIIAWNGNSGASAINVAYWLGARRIVLLGFDMGHEQGKSHWHTRYPRVGRGPQGFFPNPYRSFLKCWRAIAKDAKKIGLEILNATDGGQLHVFPRIKLEDTL